MEIGDDGKDQPQKSEPRKEENEMESKSVFDNSSSSGWFSYALDKYSKFLKDAQSEAGQVVAGCKNDLLELKDSISKDSANAASNVLPIAKSSVSSAWNMIQNLVMEEVEDEEESDKVVVSLAEDGERKNNQIFDGITETLSSLLASAVSISPDTVIEDSLKTRGQSFDKTQLAVQTISAHEDMILGNPADMKKYQEFCRVFSFTEHAGQIARLMNDYETLCKMHKGLVPAKISDDEFWKKFFFQKLLILEQDETKRKLIHDAVNSKHDETVDWEEDESEPQTVPLNRGMSETSYDMISEPLPEVSNGPESSSMILKTEISEMEHEMMEDKVADIQTDIANAEKGIVQEETAGVNPGEIVETKLKVETTKGEEEEPGAIEEVGDDWADWE